MRILESVVAVETVALGVLLVLWIAQRDAAPPPAPADGAALERTEAAGVRTGGVAAGAASSRTAERSAAPTPAAPSVGGGAVVLQGRLLGVDPFPDADEVRVGLYRDSTYRGAEVAASGVYAIPDLAPGTWSVVCDVPGYRKLELEHTLGPAPVQRLDLELARATVLRVFARTTDGERLAAALAERDTWQGVSVFATREPVVGDLPPTEHSSHDGIGIGRHRRPGDLNQRMEADGDEGTLELYEPPPAHATLLLRHLVLARLPIAPGQTELRFEVDLDDVFGRLAKVRLRVARDGQPIVGAHVGLSTAQGGGSRAVTGEDGSVLIEDVLPGLARLEIRAAGCERFATHAMIAAGEEVDLGEFALSSPVELGGRVVGADGSAVPAMVRATAIDTWRPPYPIGGMHHQSDGSGGFELSMLGRRRYVLRADSGDGRVGFAFVDAATAGGREVEVRVAKARTLRLEMPEGLHVRVVVVRDRGGDPLDVRRVEPRWRRGELHLPDGDYVMCVYDGRGVQLLEEPLTIAGQDVEKVLP